MKDYLKEFATLSEYNTYINGTPDLPNVSLVDEDNSVHYTPYVPPTDYSREYLTFEALESGTFQFSQQIDYSIDGGSTWTTLERFTATPTIAQGEKILWKGQFTQISTFSATGRFNVSGNAMSLLYGDNFVGQTAFPSDSSGLHSLFFNNTNVISAENLVLPATTLANECYQQMFQGCTSLTTVPSDLLPATTLTAYCYRAMFSGCTSLTTAPELSATTLNVACYLCMFYGCTSLETAPELPATTLAINCYNTMFYNCTNLNNITMLATDISATDCLIAWVGNVAASGTFTKAASMTTLPSGNNGIPANWTVVDAS